MKSQTNDLNVVGQKCHLWQKVIISTYYIQI